MVFYCKIENIIDKTILEKTMQLKTKEFLSQILRISGEFFFSKKLVNSVTLFLKNVRTR